MKKEDEIIDRKLLIAGNNEFKSYFYLENGIITEQRHVKIENGIEIPCESPGPTKFFLEVPKDIENANTVKVFDAATGEVSKELIKAQPIDQAQKKEEICFFKIFNKTKNIGEIHKIVNGIDSEVRFYKIENGKEVYCPQPENDERNLFVPMPKNLDEGDLSVYNQDGILLKKIPHQICAKLDNQTEICLHHHEADKLKDMIEKISLLSNEEKEKLKSAFEQDAITTLEGKKLSTTTYSEIERAVDAILATSNELVPEDFYKSVNPTEEFGISRFVVDRFYHLPQLLSEPKLTRQPNTTTYIVSSETKDSSGNGICLEHRFQATSSEEATKLAKLIIKRLQGVQHKIWLSTWRLANELKKYTYTCALTELMRLCYPERNAYFQTKEKIEFYEHLKSLENTKIVFTRKRKKSPRSKTEIEDFIEIRALEIAKGTRKPDDKYPETITITVLNTASLQNEKMAFVGAGYKHRTLELHADDTLLAQLIQTRKSQMQQSKYLKLDREYLIKLAGLSKTDKANKSEANRLLIEKLKRFQEKGILLECPKRIREQTVLRIR